MQAEPSHLQSVGLTHDPCSMTSHSTVFCHASSPLHSLSPDFLPTPLTCSVAYLSNKILFRTLLHNEWLYLFTQTLQLSYIQQTPDSESEMPTAQCHSGITTHSNMNIQETRTTYCQDTHDMNIHFTWQTDCKCLHSSCHILITVYSHD